MLQEQDLGQVNVDWIDRRKAQAEFPNFPRAETNGETTKEAHDVSDEERDDHGRWTAGGGIGPNWRANPAYMASYNASQESPPRFRPETKLGSAIMKAIEGGAPTDIVKYLYDRDARGDLADVVHWNRITDADEEAARVEIAAHTQQALTARGLGDQFYVFRGGVVRESPAGVTLNPGTARTFATMRNAPIDAYLVNKSDVLMDTESIWPNNYVESELLVPREALQPATKEAHDVSDEERDDHGRWTTGGAAPVMSRAEFEKNAYWHGNFNGKSGLDAGRSWTDEAGHLHGGGIHIGTRLAAKQALEARIGKPADGSEWDGTKVYGKTLLKGYDPEGTGYNASREAGAGPHLPVAGDVPLDAKPDIFPVRIVGNMTNTPGDPHEDFRANGYIRAQLAQGRAKNGYYYTNVSEDEGSVSAVVPSRAHLQTYEDYLKNPSVVGTGPNDPYFVRVRKAAHDVSDEARDPHGEWTAGGGGLTAHEQMPTIGSRPADGTSFSLAPRSNEYGAMLENLGKNPEEGVARFLSEQAGTHDLLPGSVAQESNISPQHCLEFMRNWDEPLANPFKAALLRDASAKFGVPLTPSDARIVNSQIGHVAQGTDVDLAKSGASVFLDAQYAATQDMYKSGEGADERDGKVTLSRGLAYYEDSKIPEALRNVGAEWTRVKLQFGPLSSWSINEKDSADFAHDAYGTAGGRTYALFATQAGVEGVHVEPIGYEIAMDVPTERIISDGIHGMGAEQIGEHVVIGATTPDEVWARRMTAAPWEEAARQQAAHAIAQMGKAAHEPFDPDAEDNNREWAHILLAEGPTKPKAAGQKGGPGSGRKPGDKFRGNRYTGGIPEGGEKPPTGGRTKKLTWETMTSGQREAVHNMALDMYKATSWGIHNSEQAGYMNPGYVRPPSHPLNPAQRDSVLAMKAELEAAGIDHEQLVRALAMDAGMNRIGHAGSGTVTAYTIQQYSQDLQSLEHSQQPNFNAAELIPSRVALKDAERIAEEVMRPVRLAQYAALSRDSMGSHLAAGKFPDYAKAALFAVDDLAKRDGMLFPKTGLPVMERGTVVGERFRDGMSRNDVWDAHLAAIKNVGTVLNDEIDRRMATDARFAPAVTVGRLAALNSNYEAMRALAEDARQAYFKTDNTGTLGIASEDYQRIRAAYKDACKQRDEAQDAWRRYAASVDRARGDIAREVLAEIRPMDANVKPNIGKYSNANARDSFVKAGAYYPKEWGDRAFARPEVESRPGGARLKLNIGVSNARAFYSDGVDRRTGQIHFAKTSNRGDEYADSTAVHELGHFMEYQGGRSIRAAEYTYYRQRTGDEPKTRFVNKYGYGNQRGGEYGRLDDFLKFGGSGGYVGKDYGNTAESAFELLTMGMENLRNPVREIPGADADFKAFILGLVATV